VNKARFEAFSDGVFAFAATLLVLGITLPAFAHPLSEFELGNALLRLWPSILAYALSFGVIGIMWQSHHALFRSVERVDRKTSLLNLGLLGVTAFIPFATSILGAYPTLRPSTLLYGLTLTGSALIYNTMLAHLVRTQAFDPRISAERTHQTVVAYRLGLITYATATAISTLFPIVSFGLYLLVAIAFLIPRGVDDDLID
jgi:uncharacterized membrane protein